MNITIPQKQGRESVITRRQITILRDEQDGYKPYPEAERIATLDGGKLFSMKELITDFIPTIREIREGGFGGPFHDLQRRLFDYRGREGEGYWISDTNLGFPSGPYGRKTYTLIDHKNGILVPVANEKWLHLDTNDRALVTIYDDPKSPRHLEVYVNYFNPQDTKRLEVQNIEVEKRSPASSQNTARVAYVSVEDSSERLLRPTKD